MSTTRSVVIEKELPHPPEKIWRALTQGPLIKEWLMENDFQPWGRPLEGVMIYNRFIRGEQSARRWRPSYGCSADR